LRRSVEDAPEQQLLPLLHQCGTLVGPNSTGQDDLAQSVLASSVAMEFLKVLSGDIQRGDLQTPYFVACERAWTSAPARPVEGV
jgi:hypothetical protein